MFGSFNFDALCGAFVQTVRSAMDACLTAFNLLDPFRFVRVSRRLQQGFLQLVA